MGLDSVNKNVEKNKIKKGKEKPDMVDWKSLPKKWLDREKKTSETLALPVSHFHDNNI